MVSSCMALQGLLDCFEDVLFDRTDMSLIYVYTLYTYTSIVLTILGSESTTIPKKTAPTCILNVPETRLPTVQSEQHH